MGSVRLRGDFDAATVRGLARRAVDADQVRRLLAIAAVYDGMSREEAARGRLALIIWPGGAALT